AAAAAAQQIVAKGVDVVERAEIALAVPDRIEIGDRPQAATLALLDVVKDEMGRVGGAGELALAIEGRIEMRVRPAPLLLARLPVVLGGIGAGLGDVAVAAAVPVRIEQ